MKYLVNLINQSPETIKEYGSNIPAEWIHNAIDCKVKISKEDFNNYIKDKKVYYYFEFMNSAKFKSRCCTFLYKEDDEKNPYHLVMFYKSPLFEDPYDINNKDSEEDTNNQYYILEDLTEKLFSNIDFYKKFYCIGKTNNFIFFDNEKECQIESLNYAIMNMQFDLSKDETRLLYLENEFTYKREFDILLNEAIEEAKIQITKKLNEEKEELKIKINNKNILISNWNHEKNKIKLEN